MLTLLRLCGAWQMCGLGLFSFLWEDKTVIYWICVLIQFFYMRLFIFSCCRWQIRVSRVPLRCHVQWFPTRSLLCRTQEQLSLLHSSGKWGVLLLTQTPLFGANSSGHVKDCNSLPISATCHGKFWAGKQPVLLSSKLESSWIYEGKKLFGLKKTIWF